MVTKITGEQKYYIEKIIFHRTLENYNNGMACETRAEAINQLTELIEYLYKYGVNGLNGMSVPELKEIIAKEI